ncbi:hypothetical protein J6590_015457 [Homalodisca vitripennis]|nr:hypothetical protein J6590_015457 [Homalodisca vitripennis]
MVRWLLSWLEVMCGHTTNTVLLATPLLLVFLSLQNLLQSVIKLELKTLQLMIQTQYLAPKLLPMLVLATRLPLPAPSIGDHSLVDREESQYTMIAANASEASIILLQWAESTKKTRSSSHHHQRHHTPPPSPMAEEFESTLHRHWTTGNVDYEARSTSETSDNRGSENILVKLEYSQCI